MNEMRDLKISGFVNITKKIIGLIWKNFKTLYISQIFLLSFNSVLNFAQPAILALLINRLTDNLVFDNNLIILLVLLVVTSILPSFIYTVQGYLNKITYLQLEQIVELEMVKLHGRLDVSQHEDPQIKDLVTRVSEDGGWRVKNFTERIIFLFQGILSLSIASVILVQARWWTLPLLLLATLPELVVSNKYGHDVWSISASESEDKRFFWSLRHHFTYLPNLLELKLFQNLEDFQKRMFKLFSKFLKVQLNNEKKLVSRLIFAQGFSQLANAFVAVFFIYQVINGNILVGTLTFLIATIREFRNSLSGFFFNLSSQYQDGLFVHDFFKLKELPRALSAPDNPHVIKKDETPLIEFKNVSFKYPNSDAEILSNLNLTIEPGTKLALVGKNGAGKTTFVKLLCRFYDPTIGQILINGKDLREIDLDSWYHHLGILFQEYSRYNFHVKDSIKVGRTSTNNEKSFLEASKQSGSHEFIQKWPQKYNQQLGRDFTDGVEPSIGQWQKLALARVFYRDPSIFVLDEPTASLDVEAEESIFNHLDSLDKNKTTILISHRFSTVRKADKIVVIENGEITEEGSHKQLLALDGTYMRLFNLQAKDYNN